MLISPSILGDPRGIRVTYCTPLKYPPPFFCFPWLKLEVTPFTASPFVLPSMVKGWTISPSPLPPSFRIILQDMQLWPVDWTCRSLNLRRTHLTTCECEVERLWIGGYWTHLGLSIGRKVGDDYREDSSSIPFSLSPEREGNIKKRCPEPLWPQTNFQWSSQMVSCTTFFQYCSWKIDL